MPLTSVDEIIAAHWWNELLAQKDALSWNVLTDRFNVDPDALRQALLRTGNTVPAARPSEADPRERMKLEAGKRPDVELAAELGISADEVRAWRRGHGIPPYLRPPPAPPPPAPPPAVEAIEAIEAVASAEPSEAPGPERPAPAEPAAPPASLSPPSAAPSAPVGASSAQPVVLRRRVGADGSPAEVVRHDPPLIQPALVPPRPPAGAGRPARSPLLEAFRGQDSGVRERADAPRSPASTWASGPAASFAAPSSASPPAPSATTGEVGRRGVRSPIEALAHQLGKVPDAEIAASVGVTVSAVKQYRVRRGISMGSAGAEPRPRSYAPPSGGFSAPTPAAPLEPRPAAEASSRRSEPAAPSALLYGWRVAAQSGTGRRSFVIHGSDVLDAVTRATRALGNRSDGPWRIIGMRELPEALE